MSQYRKCIYNKTHSLTVLDKNKGQILERNLNINITNSDNCLLIKIKDPSEYCFNYTESIDNATYETMRVNQNLDINFVEFKSNLLEMLQQFYDKELYLKCEVLDDICTMVFYGRSKIKSIVFLTVDLRATSQKEILNELIGNMQEAQDFNEKLKKQLCSLKNVASEKDQEIKNLEYLKRQSERQFIVNLQQLEEVFNLKFKEVESLLTNKIFIVKQKALRALADIEILKGEYVTKCETSKKLAKLMENMKLESNDHNALITRLKVEVNSLTEERNNLEMCIFELRRTLEEKTSDCSELQKKNEELRRDLEKATLIISQKKSTIDELSQDLLQANQMLVNFNKHYDDKVKQVEELESLLKLQEKSISDDKLRYQELLNEYDAYKKEFNSNNHHQLMQDLSSAKDKIEELEKQLRKTNKINVLLTEQLNKLGFPQNK